VGSEVVRECLADARIERVLAISRRPLPFEDPRLEVVELADFLDLSPLAARLEGVDVCFSALGVSQMLEKDPERYRVVTHDYVLALAREVAARSPGARMVFVSGQGADATGKSKVLFARVKGETERDMRALFGDRLTVVRPGVIRPVRPRAETAWLEQMLLPVAALLAPVARGLTATTVEIAHAMMQAAFGADVPRLMQNRAIRDAADAFVRQPRSAT